RLDGEERPGADAVRRLELGRRLRLRADAYRLAAAAARQLRQRRQGRLGAAEVVDELAEGDGPDVVAADQPQARQPLGGIERRLRQGGGREARQFLTIGRTSRLMIGRQS